MGVLSNGPIPDPVRPLSLRPETGSREKSPFGITAKRLDAKKMSTQRIQERTDWPRNDSRNNISAILEIPKSATGNRTKSFGPLSVHVGIVVVTLFGGESAN